MRHQVSILVVEDNDESRRMTCEMLEFLGHRTESVVTAEQALVLIKDRHFDVLLTDINLPGMSGTDLAKVVADNLPGIGIIFISGYGYLIAEKSDFKFALLAKPYRLSQLADALEIHLGISTISRVLAG